MPEKRKLPLPPQWILAIVVVAAFVPWWIYTSMGERRARLAIELYTPFTQPSLELRFPKRLYYDPQSFLGKGRQAGYWDWTPDGLVLTGKGQNHFTDNGTEFFIAGPVGRRQISRIASVQNRGGPLEVRFTYFWSDVNAPFSQLITGPPQTRREYEGTVKLVESGGVWKVDSLNTPEYEKSITVLKNQAAGARR